jgi:hypothetical protein
VSHLGTDRIEVAFVCSRCYKCSGHYNRSHQLDNINNEGPTMTQQTSPNFARQMTQLVALAIGGWAVFLWTFQRFFPDDYDPADGRGVFFAWLIGGAVAFVGIQYACFAMLKTPKHWWSAGSIALLAPALCLDSMATTFFHDWFGAGPFENTAYSATVLGGVGVMQLVALFAGRAEPASAEIAVAEGVPAMS